MTTSGFWPARSFAKGMLLAVLFVVAASTVTAQPPPITCVASVPQVALMRGEGITEPVGDVILICTGNAWGAITANFAIYLNIPVTSRIVDPGSSSSPNYTEALLTLDEPSPGSQTVGENVFRGSLGTANSLTFAGIPLATGAGSISRTIRLKNIRGNASSLPVGGGPLPQVSMFINASAMPQLITVTNNQVVVAMVQAGLGGFQFRNCADTSPILKKFSQNQSAGQTNPLATDHTLHGLMKFTEGFATGFRERLEGGQDGATVATLFPGAESAYVNTARLGATTGTANTATRLLVRFKGVPGGVSLFVTTRQTVKGTSAGLTGTLVSVTDPTGAGGSITTPVAATGRHTGACSASGDNNGVVQVPLTNGEGAATWEIQGAVATSVQSISFGLEVAFVSSQAAQPLVGMPRATGSLAPLSNDGTASATAPIPRFADRGIDKGLFVIKALSRIGIYRNGLWNLDRNNNGALDPGTDGNFFLGWPGATPVTGDWNGDGVTDVGVYSGGFWFLDYDGNGVWDGGVVDKQIGWGWAGATPVTGDWNGDGKTKIGVYSDGFWFLDYNGDYSWDGGVADKQVGWGWTGVQIVTGDWNGDGRTKIGVYTNGFWFLDYDGNYAWDGGVADKQVGWGWSGVTPVYGDWNGDGRTKIGAYAGGFWYLDFDGDYLWNYPAVDKIWSLGWAGTTPVMGDWNGDVAEEPGAFTGGFWYLDRNGNGVFDGPGIDLLYQFGVAGDEPKVGVWGVP